MKSCFFQRGCNIKVRLMVPLGRSELLGISLCRKRKKKLMFIVHVGRVTNSFPISSLKLTPATRLKLNWNEVT